MAKSRIPGRLAKSLLRGVGDLDVAIAGGDERIKIIDHLRAEDVEQYRGTSFDAESRIREQIRAVEQDIADREKKWREGKVEKVRHKVEQAALWRSVGIQERIPNFSVHPILRVAILVVLASLDFYIFAQAYAVVEDLQAGSAQWWLGGLLGLAVFVAGVVVAHQLKARVLAKAQRELLAEADHGSLRIDPDVRSRLVTTRPSALVLTFSSVIFTCLLVTGVLIRLDGSVDQSLSAIVFQALVPTVALAIELYLHDPTERVLPARPRKIDQLEKRLARLERRLEHILRKRDLVIGQIEKRYETEQTILKVEQLDLGLQ